MKWGTLSAYHFQILLEALKLQNICLSWKQTMAILRYIKKKCTGSIHHLNVPPETADTKFAIRYLHDSSCSHKYTCRVSSLSFWKNRHREHDTLRLLFARSHLSQVSTQTSSSLTATHLTVVCTGPSWWVLTWLPVLDHYDDSQQNILIHPCVYSVRTTL